MKLHGAFTVPYVWQKKKLLICLFPGLGATKRIFAQYDFGVSRSMIVEFLIPFRNETIAQYAQRMAEHIPREEDLIFIGVSFGGIIAQEVSKIIPPKKIILISTIKTEMEKPRYFYLA